MNGSLERTYKRKCFQGRGILARWLDRAFFSLLSGVCLYLLVRRFLPSLLLCFAVLLLLILWDAKRWNRFRRKLWQNAVGELRREDWMKREGARIRQAGGTILFPTPDRDALTGLCLRQGPGTVFHCFGASEKELEDVATALGCPLTFHSWGEGADPSREQVIRRLERDASKRGVGLWRSLLQLPGNRYLLAGCMLLMLSIWLRRAIYWRLLGTVCLVVGTIRRSFQRIAGT